LLSAASPGCSNARATEQAAAPSHVVHATQGAAIAVTTVEVVRRTIEQNQALTGTLVPNRKSEVAADATGKVAATLVERGALVATGAALVRLDRRAASMVEEEATAQAEAARTQQALAERECARADKLWVDGAINGAEHDRARAQCDGARLQATAAAARARLANKNLGDAVVRAPFRGMIADRYVSQGEYVRPDTRVVTLVEIDPVRLELSVPETAVHVLREAAEVAFEVAAYPGQTFHGKIRYIGPAVRRQSRDLLVEAVIANPGRKLLPGMFATAQLLTGSRTLAVVPESAIQHERDVDRAYVVSHGRLEERLLSLGARQADGIAVLTGLQPGERVVATITPDLRDGALVR
jgi:membrane fusion protein (multidrug efflux system)